MIRLFGVDIPAETSTAQEKRESKKRKSVMLFGEELPHPSAIEKIRSSSPPAPPGPLPDTIDNMKGKGTDQVFVAGKILESSDTAAAERRGSKSRKLLSGQERRKSAIKKTRSSSPPAPLEPLPPPLQQAIYNMAGTKGTEAFVARKIVERSDTEAALNRFFMPKNEKIWELLSDEERRMVEKDGTDGGLDVTLVDPSCRKYDMKLKWWKSLKKIVFNSNWRNFVEGCGLKPEVDCVELWSFRSNSKLCFAFNVRRSELHQSIIS